jgi:hypothetical protein
MRVSAHSRNKQTAQPSSPCSCPTRATDLASLPKVQRAINAQIQANPSLSSLHPPASAHPLCTPPAPQRLHPQPPSSPEASRQRSTTPPLDASALRWIRTSSAVTRRKVTGPDRFPLRVRICMPPRPCRGLAARWTFRCGSWRSRGRAGGR